MNYRHAFHAGNLPDVHKHAVLLAVLDARLSRPEPLTVIDTHAGAGAYDLGGEAARRSGEAEAGIERLLADPAPPAALRPLAAAVRAARATLGGRAYPGSPLLILDRLRRRDAYVGCELRADDGDELRRALERSRTPARWAVRLQDGYAAAPRLVAEARGRALLLIDPPYERGDEARRVAETLAAAGAPPALIWAPVKDLESYDALLRRLEDLPYAEGWSAEARLRPLTDPMRLNGSSLIGLGLPPPPGLEAISDWTARSAGEAGALGRVTPLFG